MAKIFYGNGECEIQGEDVIFCELIVKNPIEIDDKSPSSFFIKAKNNKIIIAKFSKKEDQLKEMFNYIGDLNITRAAIINKNGDKEYPVIKRVMDYTELLTSNVEDMTNLSENLKSKHLHKLQIKKMILKQPYLENMTTDHDNFYLENGSAYSGPIHISHEDGRTFTGGTHAFKSELLYFKDIYKDHVKEELVPYSYHNLRNTRTYRTFGKRMRGRKR